MIKIKNYTNLYILNKNINLNNIESLYGKDNFTQKIKKLAKLNRLEKAKQINYTKLDAQSDF